MVELEEDVVMLEIFGWWFSDFGYFFGVVISCVVVYVIMREIVLIVC